MKRILMVCHANICRSPMAEFILRDMLEKAGMGDRVEVRSAAISAEKTGEPVHYESAQVLREMGIDCGDKRAVKMNAGDYYLYDMLIGMDEANVCWMQTKIPGRDPEGKMFRLLDFTGNPRDIADPWFTGNYARARDEIAEGCAALLERLKAECCE